MSFLARFDAVSLSFGDQIILREADFRIEPGERVCLIGRNGAGKSTSLKLIAGELEADDGRIERPAQVRISVLAQSLAEESEETVRAFVTGGMAEQVARIADYTALTAVLDDDRHRLREAEQLEAAIVAGGGWQPEAQVDAMITQLDLPADKPLSALSGGWRRRVALARALVSLPDLLLLDEPTNHLDLGTIEWLENQILRYSGAVLFVTHDRSFVERVANRIVDLDRGKLRSWPGGYRDYLRQKHKADADEDSQNREFDKKLAQEEAWIRQGVKARATRNEGRVRALEAMREERGKRIKRDRSARIRINETDEVSGRKVIDVRNVSHAFGDAKLLDRFSLRVMRGDRIGIVGNNGVGKTTLLRILLGELPPNSGSVKLGTNLVIGYFDQLRRELDPERTVADIVGEGRDYITLNGKKKHVVAYLTDFLFSAKRAMTPVRALSGGERNRVLLAKLFTEGSNLLILDEPTNDLDVETLEALEQRLREYGGTLIVVSHDRHFLDAVVTSTLVFEADGGVTRHAGGYSDWMRKRHELAVGEERPVPSAGVSRPRKSRPGSSAKLSYKLQRELDALPVRIEACEARVTGLRARINEPGFYEQPYEATQSVLEDLARDEAELDRLMERWMELESMTTGAGR